MIGPDKKVKKLVSKEGIQGLGLMKVARHALLAFLAVAAAFSMARREPGGYAYFQKAPQGYSPELERVAREQVAPRMKGMRHYMDYTGAAIASSSMLNDMNEAMKERVHGNPHSFPETRDAVERARKLLLRWMGTWEGKGGYHIAWTSGATAGLKTVGEAFPWNKGSWFVYLRESHNSVLGVREYALKGGGHFRAACEGAIRAWLNGTISDTDFLGGAPEHSTVNLLAFPGEENFSGAKYPLEWAAPANRKGWRVLVDAAALAQTERLNLTKVRPDFVVVSFYKMLGSPTGLGALLIRDDAAKELRKVYWGGGTVHAASADENVKELKRRPSEMLEDGTPNYLSIVGLEAALKWAERHGGIERFAAHGHAVHCDALNRLASLRHSNGERVVRIFSRSGESGTCDPASQAPVISFNLLDREGHVHDPARVESLARSSYGIHLRAGVHCNPGGAAAYCLNANRAEEVALGLCGEEELPEYALHPSASGSSFAGAVGCGCGEETEGRLPWEGMGLEENEDGPEDPSGPLKGWLHNVLSRTAEVNPVVEALRASFGPFSTLDDSRALADFVRSFCQ